MFIKFVRLGMSISALILGSFVFFAKLSGDFSIPDSFLDLDGLTNDDTIGDLDARFKPGNCYAAIGD